MHPIRTLYNFKRDTDEERKPSSRRRKSFTSKSSSRTVQWSYEYYGVVEYLVAVVPFCALNRGDQRIRPRRWFTLGRDQFRAGIYPINFCPLNWQRVLRYPTPLSRSLRYCRRHRHHIVVVVVENPSPASLYPSVTPFASLPSAPDRTPSCSARRDFTCRCVCLIMRG